MVRIIPAVVAAALAAGTPAHAAGQQMFNLPAGLTLSEALRAVALATGQNLVAASSLLEGRTAPALQGMFSPQEAVAALLTGTGLQVRLVGDALIVERESVGEKAGPAPQDIVVTGTRIRGRGPAGAAVIAISRDEIDRSGLASTQQVLQALPQNFGGGPNEATSGFSNRDNASFNQTYGSAINLRGLGSASTLVLVNGARPPLGGATGIFVDLSLIPSAIISRVEVLADGASAIYGSDAVAGVVNILTRNDFKGAETRVRFGTADGDRDDFQIGQLVGAEWGGGHAVLAYEYSYSDRLKAADRRFASEDLRAFGGPDLREPFASPGNVFAGGRFYPIPSGQDGRGLTAARLSPGSPNVEDQWRFVDLVPKQRRHAAFLHAEQSLSDALEVSVDGFFGARHYDRRIFPNVNNLPRTVPAGNPFYVDVLGTGAPATVYYSFQRDLGPLRSQGHARVIGGSAALTWSPGRWSAELRASAAHSSERAVLVNLVNTARLNAALADPNPASAYNLFGDGPSTNRATIEKVRGSLESLDRSSVWSVQVKADGPLFALPAGDVRLAVGGEYRREHVTSPPGVDDNSAATPRPISLQGLPGPRRISAGFAELAVPLVASDQSVPLVRRLDLSLAGRVEHYSDFGTTANPKLGARWEPIEGVGLRATYGTSFRAPGFNDLRRAPQLDLIFSIALADPKSPTGTTNVVVLRGNKPGLDPERATTWTAGLDVEPRFAPGLRISAGWYDIRYRDRIASPAAELFSFLSAGERFAAITDRAPTAAAIASYYASPAFRNFFNIPQAAIGAVVDARTQNLASVHQAGVDIEARYAFRLAGGDAAFSLAGNIIDRLDQKLTPTAAPVSLVGRLGNPVRSRFRAGGSWASNGWTLSTFLNRVAGYRNITQPSTPRVASWTTADLVLGYTLPPAAGPLSGIRVALSATNLFDRDPPYVQNNNGLYTVGFDPDLADPSGRVLALQIVKTW